MFSLRIDVVVEGLVVEEELCEQAEVLAVGALVLRVNLHARRREGGGRHRMVPVRSKTATFSLTVVDGLSEHLPCKAVELEHR